MLILSQALEAATREGTLLLCADGRNRLCYPVIAGFMIDYEEQTLVTGIKSGSCASCYCPLKEREDLETVFPKRTHEKTRTQLERQSRENTPRKDPEWIHNVPNFAWSHTLVDIHDVLMVDILHQLLKGIMAYTIDWLTDMVTQEVTGERRNKKKERSVGQAPGLDQLDDRFAHVPAFPDIKIFKHFSGVTQWTGNEERTIIRQILPVITPLLVKKQPGAVHFTRAVTDFILLSQYCSHTDSTLQYMRHALMRMNKFKKVFARIRQSKQEKSRDVEGHFNFIKFHAMSHYPGSIERYGAADNFDTQHSEAAHKFLVKEYFNRTNKRDTFIEQLCRHNIRRQNMVAMEDLLLHQGTNATTVTNDRTLPTVTQPTRAVLLRRFGVKSEAAGRLAIRSLGLDPKLWCAAQTLFEKLNLPNIEGVDSAYLLNMLAVFVRNRRYRDRGITLSSRETDRLEENPRWVESYPVCLHGSLQYWVKKGKDPTDLDRLSREFARCIPHWQGQTNQWREDYVWVQEAPETLDSKNGTFMGKLPAQLKLLITVVDLEAYDESGTSRRRYYGALVKVLRLREGGRVHPVHGMLEAEMWPRSKARNPQLVGSLRFYDLSTVQRGIHVMPASLQNDGRFFINNNADWESFNEIYDPDFEVNGTRAALQFEKEYRP